MNRLGNMNLLESSFVIGSIDINPYFNTIEEESLLNWLEYKDSDWGMSRYRTDRTQYVNFLRIIDIKTFKEVNRCLLKMYKKKYPFSTKNDFLTDIYKYTIYDLTRFLEYDFISFGSPPNENQYAFYSYYSHEDKEYLDYALPIEYDIECFKQYYKHILSYLKSFQEEEVKEIEKCPKINSLFEFIEYLHSNIENFNQYNKLIKELELLLSQRNKMNPHNNYKEKLKYDVIQSDIEDKFKILDTNIITPIKEKAKSLGVCDFSDSPNYNFNGVEAEIEKIKNNFQSKDVENIIQHKKLYFEFRERTHKTFLSLQMFYFYFDRLLKSLFDFFKDSQQDEFSSFTSKTIVVNSLEELVEVVMSNKIGDNVTYKLNPLNETRKKSFQSPQQLQNLEPEPSKTSLFPELNDAVLDSQKNIDVIKSEKVKEESIFSVMEWATIFYYADETKLLSNSPTIVKRMDEFRNEHNIKTSPKSFRSKYYEAKKRININNDYPIDKLEHILPFLKANYSLTVNKVMNDIDLIKNESIDY